MSGVAVVGLGRELRGDDAFGLAAVRSWAERYPATASHPLVRFEELASAGPDLLTPLAGAWAAVLVDAVRGAGQPGRLHLLEMDDLASFPTGSASAHGWGAAETLALATFLEPGSVPDQVLIIGVEAGEFSLGAGLSPLVARAVEPAAALIEQLVQAALVGAAEAVTE